MMRLLRDGTEVDVVIRRGEDARLVFELRDRDGSAVNLAGGSCAFALAASPHADALDLKITDVERDSPTLGDCTVVIPAEETEALPLGVRHAELWGVDSNANVEIFAAGPIPVLDSSQ